MKVLIDSTLACLPVTALQILTAGGISILLAGQGPFLLAFDIDGRQIWRKRIFEAQTVHGITIQHEDDSTQSFDDVNVLLYGGCRACLAQIQVLHDFKASQRSLVDLSIGPVHDIGDWVLSAAFIPGNTPFEPDACVITAHNSVVGISQQQRDGTSSLEFSESLMASGPASVLYSACLKPLSSQQILVAAGTVFGEIHVWSCYKQPSGSTWACTLHYFLSGHRGSIFGVCISDALPYHDAPRRFLASCSDDRTIRIWDVTDCTTNSILNHHENISTASIYSQTGFVEPDAEKKSSELAVAWAHLSRIWDIAFVQSPALEEHNQIHLVSRGEDAMCQLWKCSLYCGECSFGPTQLVPLRNDRHHSGKSIWSMVVGHSQVFTGGADGGIISRPNSLGKVSPETGLTKIYSSTFQDVFAGVQPAENCDKASTITARALKQYVFVGERTLLATTEAGHLLRGTPEREEPLKTWEILHATPNRSPLLLCTNSAEDLTFMADSRGIWVLGRATRNSPFTIKRLDTPVNSQLTWMHIAWAEHDFGSSTTRLCLVATIRAALKANVFWLIVSEGCLKLNELQLELPDHFVPTSAFYDSRSRLFLLGSRAGALAVYSNVEEQMPFATSPVCIRHIHGSDAVTSIKSLEVPLTSVQEGAGWLHILTTGRDGRYSVHRVHSIGTGSLRRRDFETIDSSALPFGPNVEGAYLIKRGKHDLQHDLVLYGFRSKAFMVWNESSQSELLTVECGGAHRSWAFRPPAQGDEKAAGPGGSFIWTKAGSVNLYCETGVGHSLFQEGGHGREIKALARYPRKYTDHSRGINNAILVASGAEDTTIRLFALPGRASPPHQNVKCMRVLNRHTTGLQHLQFSKCGTYLFSSAGCEEFFVWKLCTDVPCIGIGVVLQDSLPKADDDSDARIMSFQVDEQHSTASPTREASWFLIVAAYSNGKTKILRYTPGIPAKERFEVLNVIIEGQFCLTQIQIREISSDVIKLLTSGTNGRVLVSEVDVKNSPCPYTCSAAQVHQSSIKALQIVKVSDKTGMVVTGGDDNALAVSLVQHISRFGTTAVHHRLRTLLIPKAHAAAITALIVLQVNHSFDKAEVIAASTGNDQRIIIWRFTIDLARSSAFSEPETMSERVDSILISIDELQIERLGEAWTSIADVGGMELIEVVDRGSVLECGILVVGVGMEVVKIEMGSQGVPS